MVYEHNKQAFAKFGSITPMHGRCSSFESHTSKVSLESIQVLSWVILVVSIFNMHARRPIRPHMAIKPKIEVSAGGKAFTRLSL
jgi:hypothetical protein